VGIPLCLFLPFQRQISSIFRTNKARLRLSFGGIGLKRKFLNQNKINPGFPVAFHGVK
jgi:hypothetical protein